MEKKHLTVRELIELLKDQNPDNTVALLPMNDGIVNPVVFVTNAWEGFDWWMGWTILSTDREIRADFSDVFSRETNHRNEN